MNPKESTFHTPQVPSFSSLGGISWKSRGRGQGLVFHGVHEESSSLRQNSSGSLARLLPTLPPLPRTPPPPHSHSQPRLEDRRRTSQHLQVLGTAGGLLLYSRRESLEAGSKACLRPQASLFRTNPSTLFLSDLVERSIDTFPRTSPGAWPTPGLRLKASSPLPRDQPIPVAQGPKGNSHHSPTCQSFLPSCSAEKLKSYSPPLSASGLAFTARPEPPTLPSRHPAPATPLPLLGRPSPGTGRLPSPASRWPGISLAPLLPQRARPAPGGPHTHR